MAEKPRYKRPKGFSAKAGLLIENSGIPVEYSVKFDVMSLVGRTFLIENQGRRTGIVTLVLARVTCRATAMPTSLRSTSWEQCLASPGSIPTGKLTSDVAWIVTMIFLKVCWLNTRWNILPQRMGWTSWGKWDVSFDREADCASQCRTQKIYPVLQWWVASW